MKKAPEAFRTISEVADILDTPAHVLRFWESKFYQIRPVKRAGGRRYYRPDDVALINGIRNLLQDQGMTIRGVQRVLQEQGVKHVAGLGSPLPLGPVGDEADIVEGSVSEVSAVDSGITAAPVQTEVSVDGTDQPALPMNLVDDTSATSDDVIEDVEPAEQAAISDAAEPVEMSDDIAAPLDAALPVDPEDPAPEPAHAEPPAAADATPDETPADPSDEDTMTDSDELAPPVAAQPQIDLPIDILTERPPAPPLPLPDADPAMDDIMEPSERARIARALRATPRGQLGAKKDSMELLSRRIDTLLERMSEASGAGRW